MNMYRHRCALAVALVVIVGGAVASAQVQDFKPVTDAMLENPDPADWLNWRRTLDGWGYSPLNQINKENVDQLELVWSRQLGPGLSQPTPIVYNGDDVHPQSPRSRARAGRGDGRAHLGI